MVILGSQNKITDFFMILAWASPFQQVHVIISTVQAQRKRFCIAM